jgi:hypothetical protein
VQIKPATSDDLNRLVTWENMLTQHLAPTVEVDGHDLGSGEFNVFVFPDDPSRTFQKIHELPETKLLSGSMTAAYRPVDGEESVLLWPLDATQFNLA